MIVNAVVKGGGGDKIAKLSFNGSLRIEGNVLRLLSSGVLTLEEDYTVDVFLVGAGGAGGAGGYWKGANANWYTDGGGGGGGYTATHLGVQLKAGVEYSVIVGAGSSAAGGSTSFADMSVSGGAKGGNGQSSTLKSGNGGNGGSGGGAGRCATSNSSSAYGPGAGGTNGGNGGGSGSYGSGGTGQGGTTKEFGEEDGLLYASGGNGGSRSQGSATAGAANTGNGGQGGCNNGNTAGAVGGSGIVCLRFPEGIYPVIP